MVNIQSSIIGLVIAALFDPFSNFDTFAIITTIIHIIFTIIFAVISKYFIEFVVVKEEFSLKVISYF